MPNQKVPQLPVLTDITDADLFYVVDVSDTTDDPTGSSKQVTREEILTNVSYVEFNTTATTTHAEGRIHWNNDLKTLEVDTENPNVHVTVGQELISRVNNQTGGTLLKGRAVYINGQQGQRPTVTYATFTADTTSAGVIGLVADDINDNSNGYIISYGLIEGVDTSAYSAGTPLYLYTGGTITDVKPQAPDHDVRIGKVIVSNATTGSIFVNIQNGYELDELHDVRITTPTTDDVLVRSSYNGIPVWVNTKTLSGLTYVGATTISGGTVSSSGDVTAGGVLKSTQSSGDEGGEVQLATAQTNSSLSGNSVTIDIFQNKLRIFESGGSNRGVFVDITESIGGVGTDLLNPFIPSLTPQEIFRGVTFSNNSTTVTTSAGITMSTTASNLAISVSSANFYEKQIRLRYYSTTVTGGRYTGTRGSALLWYIHGGFRYICNFRISDTGYSSTAQQFYGMAGVTADLGYGGVGLTKVSTLTNIIGVGNDDDDTNLQIIHNDSSGVATKVDLGVDFPANRPSGSVSTDVYSVTLYNAETSSDVKYMVINKTTGAVATGTITTNLPATTQGLNFFASRTMGGGGGVTGSGQFELMKLGVFSLL